MRYVGLQYRWVEQDDVLTGFMLYFAMPEQQQDKGTDN